MQLILQLKCIKLQVGSNIKMKINKEIILNWNICIKIVKMEV